MKSVFFDKSSITSLANGTAKNETALYAAKLLSAVENGTIFGATSSDVFGELYDNLQDTNFLAKLRILLFIFPVDEKIIQKALDSKWDKYRIAINYQTALQGKIDVIITEDPELYKKGTIPVQTPKEFLATNSILT